MHPSPTELDSIRRYRRKLVWTFLTAGLVEMVTFSLALTELMRGRSIAQVFSFWSNPFVLFCFAWLAVAVHHLAKAIDPRPISYWTYVGLTFLPLLNLAAVVLLFIQATRILAGTRPIPAPNT